MIANYLILTWRNVNRQKVYSFINIFGLTLGLTCCFFLFLFIQDELAFDTFHEKKERIYRVTFSTSDDKQPTNANGSFGVGPALVKDFPEVQLFTRIDKGSQGDKTLIRYEDKTFKESGFIFADSSLFKIFTLPLLKGNADEVLTRPNTVVISERMANKYFGSADPVGMTIKADFENRGALKELEVTGVMKDIPLQSHFHADFIASIYSRGTSLTEWFGFQPVYTYVLLHDLSQIEQLSNKLKGYSREYMGEDAWYEVGLQPMPDIHLHSELRSEFEPNGNITAVYIFVAIGMVILLLACFNFTMLATARSLRRAREVGLRKTLGARRKQLIAQFLGESFLYTITSGALSLILIKLLLPQFNSFTGKALQLSLSTNVYLIVFVVGVILLTAILAGIYPAFSLSSLTPALTLRGGTLNQSSFGNIRKALVVTQFSISIVLISATLIIREQMELVRQTATLNNDDHVIVLPINTEIQKKFKTVKDVLTALPGVSNVSGASILPSKGSSTNCFKIQDIENELCAYTYLTDVDFLRTHDFKIIAGRDFNASLTSDSLAVFIVNKEALVEMGINNIDEALNKTIEIGPIKGNIIGIAEDFHTWSLHDSINSTVIATWKPGAYNYISIRATAGSIPKLLPEIENVWNKFSHAYPFDYFFLDESFAMMHAKEMKTAKTLGLFSLIAILISCLGVIGVASYMAEQRTKEVGIRKTLGASVSTVLFLFNKDFVKLIAIALVLAGPLVWFVMNRWLQGFVYRVQVSPWNVVLAGSVALFLMLLSVSYFTLRAARANPLQSLRSE